MARKGPTSGRAARLGVALVAAAAGAVACTPAPPTVLRGEGVRARQVPAEAHAAASAGGVDLVQGDFVLEGPRLRVVVGGMRRYGEARGAILEALPPGVPPDDSVTLFAPRVHLGQRAYPLRPREVFLVERRGRPAVRLEGTVRVEGRTLRVVREVTLGGDGTWVSIATRVEQKGDRVLDGVRVGARIAWGGAPPFVPGAGGLEDADWHDVSWVGRDGGRASPAFAFHGPPFRVRGVYDRHGEAAFLSHTEVASSRVKVPADGFVRSRSTLAVVRGGLSEPVRRLGWSQGRPYREVLVTLPYVPEGASVAAFTEDGAPVIRAGTQGTDRVLLPLPPIRRRPAEPVHLLRATAYGHATSDPVAVGADDRRAELPIPRGGHVRVSVSDARGRPMPGRARFEGLSGSPAPDLGPVWRAGGAEDTVVTTGGDVVVPLSPGRYRVRVSRGPEWTLVDETVEVTETFQPHVRARLRRVVDPGDWVPCDFHLHAAPSYDSEVGLEDRVASLVAEGVRFAVPTDHNHVTDYGPAVRALDLEGFGTVPGVEVSTWDPSFGHFNAYPFPVRPELRGNGAPRYKRTTPAALFASLRDAGDDVVVQVNHPRLEPDVGYFDLMGLDPTTGSASDAYSDDFDVLEVWNGFDIARPAMVERVFSDWLALLARGRRVVANGSSDSHQIPFQWAGYPRTYVKVEGGDPEDAGAVVRALRAGRAFVTDGPFLEAWVGDAGVGEVGAARDGVLAVRVRVRAPAWMAVDEIDLFVGAELVRTVPVGDAGDGGAVRFDRTVELAAPDGDAFVVVRVRGREPMDAFFGREEVLPMAFTNPIWVDADGDGTVPWREP
ncbi:MAG: CehA/McbA family metallohydrolase [Myxococcota bacterium]